MILLEYRTKKGEAWRPCTGVFYTAPNRTEARRLIRILKSCGMGQRYEFRIPKKV